MKMTLSIHFVREHHKCIPDSKFACQSCDFRAITLIELLDHTQSEHTKKVQVQVHKKQSNPVKISCDKCDYKCHLNIQLRRHKKTKHSVLEKEQKYLCDSCDYSSTELPEIWAHKLQNHDIRNVLNQSVGNSPIHTILNILIDQNACIVEELDSLKTGVAGLFNQLGGSIHDNFDYIRKENSDRDTASNGVLKSILDKVDNLDIATRVRTEGTKAKEVNAPVANDEQSAPMSSSSKVSFSMPLERNGKLIISQNPGFSMWGIQLHIMST